jgi:hypothetical protein
MSEDQFEEQYKDYATTVRQLGEYQDSFNDIKNILKHGKAVFQGDINSSNPNHIIFLTWHDNGLDWELHAHHFDASLEQLEIAVIQIAKIYIRAMELLWLFMLHYHPDHSDKFLEIMKREGFSCAQQVRDRGIHSEGLTDMIK